MNYFDTILRSHHLDKCPEYLWQIKTTDEEYIRLRRLLRDHIQSYLINPRHSFTSVQKECALYISEFWRREYKEGAHSVQMILTSLGFENNENLNDAFYEAARKGAKSLGIEQYRGSRTSPLNDMLYQGGLPMKLITGNESDGVWDRFTRGLINRKINFDDLDLGIVASQSQCLREYCEQLIHGIEADSYILMPFFCQDRNNAWFIYLEELAKEEKTRQRQSHPFSLFWEFSIDKVEKKINVKYVVKGLQHLPDSFLKNQKLDGKTFFSIQIRKNGQAVDTFDYNNNYCRYAVISKHPYNAGDYISLFLHDHENPYLGDSLDMEVPHLLYRNNNGKFGLGNHLGRDESFLIIPAGWEVENASSYPIQEYMWGNTQFSCIQIAEKDTNDIIVKSEDDKITFGINSPLYWTELMSHPLYIPNIVEPVYNASRCIYKLCYDTEDGPVSRQCSVKYRNKWEKEWTETPSYGEIYARATAPNGHYTTPVCLINIGDGISVNLLKADKESCQIRISWPHGYVSTSEGKRKANDIWEIRKEDCTDPRKIRFTFVPEDNSRNLFTLSLKAPFKDFSIVNIYDECIDDNCWIPYSDLDKYQYHIVGQNIRKYTYGNIQRELNWIDDELYIMEYGHPLKKIPYEGNLLTLFGSREELQSMLEQTSQNMINAEIKVRFTLDDDKKICFSIKQSPFRPKQLPDGHVVIMDNNRKPARFYGILRLIKLDDPEMKPVEISFNKDSGYYTLPEEIRPWGKTILIGRTKGRICPTLVDLNQNMDDSERKNNRLTTIESINENLKKSKIGDKLWHNILGWFMRCQKDDIPASSILELYCTSKNSKALICLSFLLYIKFINEDEHNLLTEQLKSFSNDLAFQWYWLQPYLKEILVQLYPFINDPMIPEMKNLYIKWALKQEGETRIKYLSALDDSNAYMENFMQCLNDILSAYTDWMYGLCISSMTETYESHTEESTRSLAETIIKNPENIYRIEIKETDYIDTNQYNLDEETNDFFNCYSEPGKSGNEQWLYRRVNALAAHINQKTDLFRAKDEIRRSIIYCCKSNNSQFLILLNNKLSK